MIRFVIFVLLIGMVLYLIRSYFLSPKNNEEPSESMDMVECAQCEIYVPRNEGTFQEMQGKEKLLFCSEHCARKYREKI